MNIDEKIDSILSRDLWLKKDFEESKKDIKDLIKEAKSEQLSVAWKALEWVGFTKGEEFTDDDIQEMLNA